MDSKKLKQMLRKRSARLKVALAVVLFGAIGLYALNASSASTSATSKEAEAGTLTGNAGPGNAAGASGSASVKFGVATTLPPPGGVLRAFRPTSYWNTKFPANAPIDSESARFITDSVSASGAPHLQLTGAPGTGQSYAQPIFWAKSTDKEYSVVGSSPVTKVRIPSGASAADGTDGQIVIFDQPNNQVVGIHRANYSAATDTWSTTSNADRWRLDSDGLDNRVAGAAEPYNFGHRGVPASIRAVRLDEVKAGAVEHRLECFWHRTAERGYWPMAGYESGKGGIVPEGIVIRIKPSINIETKPMTPAAKVIARALQQYGCMVGDNSGGSNRLKIERNEAAWKTLGITLDSMAPIPWSEWEFVQGGYLKP